MSLKSIKKGEIVALVGFTGMRLSDVEVTKVTKTSISIVKLNGDELEFDRKTGIQIGLEEEKEKYANKIMLVEDAPEKKPRSTAKTKRKETKKKAMTKVEDEDFEDEDDEEDEEKEVKPAKSKKAKKTTKKPKKKVVEVEEDEDDEEDEDWEDEE